MTPQAVSFKEPELIAAEAARAKRQLVPAVQSAPVVSEDQIDLITRTVAPNATADELKLYLFDCARQGVHPLDRLIHFTLRKQRDGSRKYTPITSIDFMRIRAAETGEYAGSDDAVFPEDGQAFPSRATVTVWRLVGEVRCPFTATARWSEYKPEQDDFMWRKLPHTMLAKCAEALALRKGFPRQLAGLYAKEEMDQAGPANGVLDPPPAPAMPPSVVEAGRTPVAVTGETHGPSDSMLLYPPGYALITEYSYRGGWHEFTWGQDAQGGAWKLSTKKPIGFIAQEAAHEAVPVKCTTTPKPKGRPGEAYLETIEKWSGSNARL